MIWIGLVAVVMTGCSDDGDGETTVADTVETMTTSASGTTAGVASTSASSGDVEASTGAASSGTDGMGTVDTSTGGATTGSAVPTWNDFAMGFFETYCWECHGPGDALRDYSMLSAVMAEANTIRCGTAPVGSMLADCEGEPPASQFPVGATLPTDDERAMLVEWIEAGLPEG